MSYIRPCCFAFWNFASTWHYTRAPTPYLRWHVKDARKGLGAGRGGGRFWRREGREHEGVHREGAYLAHRHLVPRVAPATLGAGAGGGAPPSSSPPHFTEHDIYDQELGRPMRVKG